MKILQESGLVREGWWRWSIWLDAGELEGIDHVQYTLHPTFHPRFVKVGDPRSGFRLTSESSAPFAVGLRVQRTDGRVAYAHHTLTFTETKKRRVLICHSSDLDDPRITEAAVIAERLGWDVAGASLVSSSGAAAPADIETMLAESVGVIVVEGPTPSRWLLHELQTARSLGKPIVSIGGGWASLSVDADVVPTARAIRAVLRDWEDNPDKPSTHPPPRDEALGEAESMWRKTTMKIVESLRTITDGLEAALYTLPTRGLFALDRIVEALSTARSLSGASRDWLLYVNSANIIEFCRRRFPEEFERLDDGDKRIMASFLDPNAVSNTRSLLGDALLARAELSELDLPLEQVSRTLADMFGRNATFASPAQVFATIAAREGADRWYFINGISTSQELALRNAQRLSQLFRRDFITIYNPTQGFVRDLVESALQKFTNVNTETVARAFVELADALSNPAVAKVRVVAHSQGTIVMGDVLDLIYYSIHEEFYRFTNMNSEDIEIFLGVSHGTLKSDELREAVERLQNAVASANGRPSEPRSGVDAARRRGRPSGLQPAVDAEKRRNLLSKLELYLFANAASNVCYMHAESGRDPLPLIESFANEHDAVARLGCLAKDRLHATGLIRIDGPTFVAAGRYGHLLNLHYLRDFEVAFASDTPVYRPLPVDKLVAPCVGESLNDPVRANPCALNPLHVPGPVRMSSNLVRLFEAARNRSGSSETSGATVRAEPSDAAWLVPRAPSASIDPSIAPS
jgi:hypothetical protein